MGILNTAVEATPGLTPPGLATTGMAPRAADSSAHASVNGSRLPTQPGNGVPPTQHQLQVHQHAHQLAGGARHESMMLASQLTRSPRRALDSDDEAIGADPDEVAFAQGFDGEDSANWDDLDKLW